MTENQTKPEAEVLYDRELNEGHTRGVGADDVIETPVSEATPDESVEDLDPEATPGTPEQGRASVTTGDERTSAEGSTDTVNTNPEGEVDSNATETPNTGEGSDQGEGEDGAQA